MDRTSFLALLRATNLSGQGSQEKPPSIILGILVYLLGLGYDVQLSGHDAEMYLCNSCGGDNGGNHSPPKEGKEEGNKERDQIRPVLSPARVTGSDGGVEWSSMSNGVYSFVMDAEHPSVKGVTAGHVCLIDQLHVRVILGKDAIVHCSRHIFQKDEKGIKEVEETFQQALEALIEQKYTTCTVGRSSDGMFVMDVASFVDESTAHGLKNIDDFLSILAGGLCEGSTRSVMTGAPAREGQQSPSILEASHRSTDYGDPSSRDTRVGYADVNPVDPSRAGQGLGPGGMMVGPHHPIFGRGRLEPPHGREGHLPPGARWDPIGPPGTQGFFPGDFERRNQANRDVHPDMVHPDIMQPGRSQPPDWL